MLENTPTSNFLTRNVGALSEDVLAERRLYQDHYVLSPALTVDVSNEDYKRLCQKRYQVGRIVLINNYRHVEINCSEERMKGDAPRNVIVEKAAGYQVSDIMHAGFDYGMVCIRALTGVDPEIVAELEATLLPIHIEKPSLRESLEWIKSSDSRINALRGSADIIALARKLKPYLIQVYEEARRKMEKSLRDSLIEIAKGRAGKGGRNDLDDFDRECCHALEKVPQDELELMVKKEKEGLASKRDDIDVVDSEPKRRCDWCAEMILESAYMCKHCKKTKDDILPSKKAAPVEPSTATPEQPSVKPAPIMTRKKNNDKEEK